MNNSSPGFVNEHNPIRVLLNYSRSGGTMLSRVVGMLPDVVFLSEINPGQQHTYHYDIAYQMKNWYGVNIHGKTFDEKIHETLNWCGKNGKILVIRDVSAFDFLPNPTNAFKPSGRFQLLESLKEQFALKPIAFVRDAMDVWISRHCPPRFSSHYLQYIQGIKAMQVPVFRFENFCANPKSELANVCNCWDVPFAEEALQSYKENLNVTGDNQMGKVSRGLLQNTIAPLKRKRIANELIQQIERDADFQEANRLMDYPLQYFSQIYEYENSPPQIWVDIKFQLRKWLKRYPVTEE